MSQETREKIMQAAVRLFSEEGYRGTTTRKIAEAAGVNESTLFRTFESKDTLFREILSLSDGLGNIIRVIEGSDLGQGISVLLKEIADLYGDLYRDNPYLMKIFYRSVVNPEERAYYAEGMGPGAYRYLADLFRRFESSTTVTLCMSPDRAAFYFLSLVHGSFQRSLIFRELPGVVDTAEIVELFTQGIVVHTTEHGGTQHGA